MSGNGRISLETFMEYCNALGIAYPSNPSGAMSGPEIIAAINTTLGYSFWQQGISGTVFVNDFGQDSADLAPYLNIDGKWHFPDGTIIIVNTEPLSVASLIGRNIVNDGALYISPSTGGGSKGITLYPGVGVGDCVIEQNTSNVFIGDVAILGSDASRPVFAGTGGTLLSYISSFWGAINPGGSNAATVSITTQLQILFQSNFVIGPDCKNLDLSVFNTVSGYVSSQAGYDISSAPTAGSRVVNINQVTTEMPPSAAFLTIASDDGSNQVFFSDCEWNNSGGGVLVYATADAAFNANPLNSVNFTFQVFGYGVTQRVGEQYFNGSQVIAIAVADTYYDLFAAAIADGGLSNGIVPTSNPGEFEYILPDSRIVNVSLEVQGTPTSGSNNYTLGAFFQPNAGSYAALTKTVHNYPIEDTDDPSTVSNALMFSLTFALKLSYGDKFKFMVKNLGGTQDFTLLDFACVATIPGGQ